MSRSMCMYDVAKKEIFGQIQLNELVVGIKELTEKVSNELNLLIFAF